MTDKDKFQQIDKEELENVAGGCGGGDEPAEPAPTEYFYEDMVDVCVEGGWKPICPNQLSLYNCNACAGLEFSPWGHCNGHHKRA